MSDELVDAFNTLSHVHHGTRDPNLKSNLLDGTVTELRVLLEQACGHEASESPVLDGVHKGEQPTTEELVGAVNALFGVHHRLRSLPTKGVILEGTFAPSASAMTVSSAGHFQDRVVPVMARFSNFAGLPNIADNDPMAIPRGMAIRFYLPDWSETDIVAHSYNGFPTKTASEFKDLSLALAAAGDPGAPDPAALNQFLSTHPIAKAFWGGAEAGVGEVCDSSLFWRKHFQVYERPGRHDVRALSDPACSAGAISFRRTSGEAKRRLPGQRNRRASKRRYGQIQSVATSGR